MSYAVPMTLDVRAHSAAKSDTATPHALGSTGMREVLYLVREDPSGICSCAVAPMCGGGGHDDRGGCMMSRCLLLLLWYLRW